MSLKANLNQMIKDRRGAVLTLQELEKYCQSAGYKLSNAERRLRPSESPFVTGVDKDGRDTDHHKAIVGYRWKQSEVVASFLRDYPSKVKEPVPSVPIGAMF